MEYKSGIAGGWGWEGEDVCAIAKKTTVNTDKPPTAVNEHVHTETSPERSTETTTGKKPSSDSLAPPPPSLLPPLPVP